MSSSTLEDDNCLLFNLVDYTKTQFLHHPLFKAARRQPSRIDALLRPYLQESTLPEDLAMGLKDYTTKRSGTTLYGMNIVSRPKWFYANSLIIGTLLGRALALLSTPVRPPKSLSDPAEFPFSKLPAELRLQIYDSYKTDIAQRRKCWDIMVTVFHQALYSVGSDPEDGARYTAGVLLLTCGHALSVANPPLYGRGSGWQPYRGELNDPDKIWDWHKLQQDVYQTERLERDNNNISHLRLKEAYVRTESEWGIGLEYVSNHTLEVLDLTREHLRNDERDWTPPEMSARLLNQLFDNEEARRIWTDTGLVPQKYEQRYAKERGEAVAG